MHIVCNETALVVNDIHSMVQSGSMFHVRGAEDVVPHASHSLFSLNDSIQVLIKQNELLLLRQQCAAPKVEGVRRKPQAKRQNREGGRKKSRGCGENRKQNGKTMGESKKTASKTSIPWGRATTVKGLRRKPQTKRQTLGAAGRRMGKQLDSG